MRRTIISYFVIATLFSGCAYDGVIVEKRFRPLPFPDSLGLDAMYNFHLRDSAGQIHSQMVTADVFASYGVGDYFNDLQSLPSHEGKEIKGFRPTPLEMNEGPHQPVRVMQSKPPASHEPKIAGKARHHTQHSSKTAKARHRIERTSKIAKTRHHTKKRAKVAGKHRRAHHLKTVASTN